MTKILSRQRLIYPFIAFRQNWFKPIPVSHKSLDDKASIRLVDILAQYSCMLPPGEETHR
jgi:hypothetical protein